MKCFATFCAFAALWICGIAQAADVRAWLDRSTMQLGETVTLNVEVSGDTRAPQPDFGALAQDFELTGTQSSTSMNIVNGTTSAKLLWAVGLQPKRAGTLTIPALDVAGARTQPLTLTVQPASATPGGKAGDDVYVEATVEPHAPYVQQQMLLTVKLYFALNLSDGNLDEPQADGIVVRKLGQDANYSADVGGRRYRVLERRYALFAEKSGALTLPALAFRGHAIDPADINSFFSRGRVVVAHSPAIALDVRARPAASGTDTWLPARSLTLSADGPDANANARVGEPLTLTLHLKAQGLGFEHLPELKLPKIDGADIYPDKATTQNHDDGEWLLGERERKFAVVPNRAGDLKLPAISVAWWDTAHDRAETAQIPALTLHVEPAAASTSAPTPELHPAPVPKDEIASMTTTAGSVAETQLWRTLAFFALTLWALTLAAWIAWLVARRRGVRAMRADTLPAKTDAAPRAAFNDAMRRADWPAAAHALLAWARATRPDLRNLGELARALADPAQRAAVLELDRSCYAGVVADGLGEHLKTAFRTPPQFAQDMKAQAASALPPLYPNPR